MKKIADVLFQVDARLVFLCAFVSFAIATIGLWMVAGRVTR